jgi:outer membrane protein OmpA-like peptidoglycan-associated protein
MSFSSPVMTAPVEIHRLAAIASPPAIRFHPEFVADTSIADWNITVFQSDKELLHFSSESGSGSGTRNKLWPLTDVRLHQDRSAIGYRIVVHDVTGQTASSEGAFTVRERRQRRTTDPSGRLELLEYTVLGFDYNSAELLPRHRHQIDAIVRALGGGSQLLVEGYTDRVGGPERNRQLSLERANAVAAAIRDAADRLHRPLPATISVQGLGQHGGTITNDLPEGRILSRMVRVTISRAVRR